MGLKKSTGNMYPWVSHTHSHLGGECPHKCSYCYVDNPRFGRPEKYKGPLRLIEGEFDVKYGTGKTIFIENCNDMWAKDVPISFINRVLIHCLSWPDNTYVFQTKNPIGYSRNCDDLPTNSILGCTIETNRDTSSFSKAPLPSNRVIPMMFLPFKKFITIEPILDFDVDILSKWIAGTSPDFVNIGADSKGHGLPEPPMWKVEALIKSLKESGIEIREKHNLERLMR